jgi:hypothetical protein
LGVWRPWKGRKGVKEVGEISQEKVPDGLTLGY